MLIIHNAHSTSSTPISQRKAIVTFEAIIWLPVLLIILAAVIEMGAILTGSMHVAAASRLGAKLAAEDPLLGVAGTPMVVAANVVTVATSIRARIDTYFESAGYGANASEGVRIQTTLNGGQSEASGTCPEQNSPALPATPPDSVRVVVCADVIKFSPNLLLTFGFDTSSLNLELSTTFPYEDP